MLFTVSGCSILLLLPPCDKKPVMNPIKNLQDAYAPKDQSFSLRKLVEPGDKYFNLAGH